MSLSNQTLAYGQSDSQMASSERSTLRRAATASFMGNFVEWFDYAAYGYLAAVIAVVFFPATDKTTGLLATFAVFAIYGLFAAAMRAHVISRPAIMTWMRRTFAAAFVLLGVRLAFAER